MLGFTAGLESRLGSPPRLTVTLRWHLDHTAPNKCLQPLLLDPPDCIIKTMMLAFLANFVTQWLLHNHVWEPASSPPTSGCSWAPANPHWKRLSGSSETELRAKCRALRRPGSEELNSKRVSPQHTHKAMPGRGVVQGRLSQASRQKEDSLHLSLPLAAEGSRALAHDSCHALDSTRSEQ